MSIARICLTLSCCLFVLAALAMGQNRKPGLWEVTTEMTWQQSPLPPGMAMPPGAANPFAGGRRTTLVCLTQAQLDRDAGMFPRSRGDCQATNIVRRANGVTADWVCTGRMQGKGTVETTWYSDGHSKGKVHFTGTMQAGPNSRPVEWTSESTSIFKGADCGDVKPLPAPAN